MNLDGTPDEEDLEFYGRYGPWDAVDPVGLQTLMDGFGKPWWVVGGYAMEAFTGVPRPHEDVDLVVDLEDVTWVDERGIRFLNPEIVLLFKAAQHRPKDEHDLDTAWPLLSAEKQGWLREALQRYDGEHPWNARLAHA